MFNVLKNHVKLALAAGPSIKQIFDLILTAKQLNAAKLISIIVENTKKKQGRNLCGDHLHKFNDFSEC